MTSKTLGTRLAELRQLAREASRIFSERGARLMSGSIAYYALVSVVPTLVIALTLASLAVGDGPAESATRGELARWAGPRGAETVMALVKAVRSRPSAGPASFGSALLLVWAATRLFSQLTTALDLLWETPPLPPARSFGERVRRQIEKRSLAFAMVLGVGLSLTATVAFHGALASARQTAEFHVPLSRAIEGPASVCFTALLFAAMFRVLPRARVEMRDALVGGALTAVLFTLGSWLITAWVTRSDTSVYGAAASIVVLLLWMNYSAQVFFLGAAFTRAHALGRRRGQQSSESRAG